MRKFRALGVFILGVCCIAWLSGCQATKQPGTFIGDMQGKNDNETAVFSVLSQLQEYVSASEWDKWLALYSDDAILTLGEKKVSKEEMREAAQGIKKYTITNMAVLQKVVGSDDAFVSTRFLGNGKETQESYKLKKIDGNWLIVEEMNP